MCMSRAVSHCGWFISSPVIFAGTNKQSPADKKEFANRQSDVWFWCDHQTHYCKIKGQKPIKEGKASDGKRKQLISTLAGLWCWGECVKRLWLENRSKKEMAMKRFESFMDWPPKNFQVLWPKTLQFCHSESQNFIDKNLSVQFPRTL